MPRPRRLPSSAVPPLNPSAAYVRVRTRVFEMPPVRDALVIGADAPPKAKLVSEAFHLLQNGEFSRLEAGDGRVGSILVRTALLRRIGSVRLGRLIRRRIRHFMTSREVLALQIELETFLHG